MTTFYFNDVLPVNCDVDIVTVFEGLVKKAANLISILKLSPQIVTEKTSDRVLVCGVSLSDIIARCRNRDVKTEAYFLFSHNTIRDCESEMEEAVSDSILQADYKFDGQDATNLAFVFQMEMPVLSMPLSPALKNDYLIISSQTGDSLKVANYYAQDDTSFIEGWINKKRTASLEGFEKLLALFGTDNVLFDREFKKEWKDAGGLYQRIAYERFKYAQDCGLLSPGRCDDVTVQKDEVDGTPDVYELRQKGQGVRVYFGYSDDGVRIVLASFCNKSSSSGVEQSADIARAQKRIKRALALAKEMKA